MYNFAVIGLGYVGLRVAYNLARNNYNVLGYDIKKTRIDELSNNYDHNLDINTDLLSLVNIDYTCEPSQLKKANFYFIDIDTPINEQNAPDISALKKACETLSLHIKKDDIVVIESTVAPGTTEDVLINILESGSNLKSNTDFFVGYSPERIVPGDLAHDLENTAKIVSAQNTKTLNEIKYIYEKIINAPVALAKSIKVAEAAKILENIQRDINIALVNEFAVFSKKLDISIYDVLDVAKTKWNFIPFNPGLVGGHCIPVDPYYLIAQAKAFGIDTPLIETARQVNNSMVDYVVNLVMNQDNPGNILIMGLSYKPDIADVRNSLSIKIFETLQEKKYSIVTYDPIAYIEKASVNMHDWQKIKNIDTLIVTVAHAQFKQMPKTELLKKLNPNAMVIDIPNIFNNMFSKDNAINYWSF